MGIKPIKLVGSQHKGTRVLIIDPDISRSEKHELECESDPRMQRIDTYFVSTLESARDAVRKYNCKMAIFPENLGQYDFVNTQIELKHANPSIQMVVLVDNPSLDQLRSSKRVGGVYDFYPLKTLNDSQSICSTILTFLRDSDLSVNFQTQSLEYTEILRTCLTIKDPNWQKIKTISQRVINNLVLDFDLSDHDVARVLAAEQIFLPWLQEEDYRKILGTDKFDLLDLLSKVGSWGPEIRQPNSSEGFAITFSNWASEIIASGRTSEELLEEVVARPLTIRHSSIKLITKEKIDSIFSLTVKISRHG